MRPILLLAALVAAPAWANDDDVGDDGDDHEVQIQISELPAAVRAAVDKKWPGATLHEAEREGGIYEVELTPKGGHRLEVELKADGTIVKVETEDDEDDD